MYNWIKYVYEVLSANEFKKTTEDNLHVGLYCDL